MRNSLRARVFAALDAADKRGAFETRGELCGLDAGDIADGLAADFDDRKDGMLWEAGSTTLSAEEIAPHVVAWLADRDR